MDIVLILAPFSVFLGALGLTAFWWTLRNGQYDDPKGDAERILFDADDRPCSPAKKQTVQKDASDGPPRATAQPAKWPRS